MAYLIQFSNSVPIIKFYIDQVLMTIGQSIDMDICVLEDGVAENHATFETIKQSGSYKYIIKANRKDSLLEINGHKVSRSEINNGDWLVIGGVEFQFTDDGVNAIKEISTATISAITAKIVKKKQTSESSSEALQIVKQLKEELKPMTTKEFIEDSRQNTRRRISF